MSELPARQCLLVEDSATIDAALIQQLVDWSTSDFLWVAERTDAYTIMHQHVRRYLGQAFPLVIFDARQQLAGDALGAVMGMVKAGGLLVLLWPSTPTGFAGQRIRNLFAEFSAQSPACFRAVDTPDISYLRAMNSPPDQPFELNAGQQTVLTHILHQSVSAKPQPLVLEADRGRGKSAVLGVTAANLWLQQAGRIIVTAPGRTNVNTLFEQASRHAASMPVAENPLVPQSRGLMFMAPDALLKHQPSTDLLLVDEAAGIPVFMLTAMLACYPNSVFASTLHGYEGSGRGFKLQFHKQLDRFTPHWQELSLEQPIRWQKGDPLEKFSFRALLLDADPPDINPHIDHTALVIKTLSAEQLMADEDLLSAVFALLVSAHYRTRPSDLQRLLDDANGRLDVMFYQQQLLAVCWSCREGPLSQSLAKAVFNGERRPPGQLLPQTLLAHAGLAGAGLFSYQRIIRIAVHPQCQRQRLGSRLLKHLASMLASEVDMLGCNYAASQDVAKFWQLNQFSVAGIGLKADHISGRLALTCLRPLNPKAGEFAETALRKLSQRRIWLEKLLGSQLPAFFREMLREISEMPATIAPARDTEVSAFAFNQRHFDNSRLALAQYIAELPTAVLTGKVSTTEKALLEAACLQQQPVTWIVNRFGFAGKKALYKRLRQIVRRLLSD